MKDRAGARAEMEQGPYGTGLTKRRLMRENDRARAEMGHEHSKHDRARKQRRKQRDIVSEERKAKEKSLTDSVSCQLSTSTNYRPVPIIDQRFMRYSLSTYSVVCGRTR